MVKIIFFSIKYDKIKKGVDNMHDKTSNSWLKLDNASTIYPSTLSRKFAAMFRLTITLKDNVDVDVLNTALNNIIDRFPTFKYKLKKGLFWYYFKQINKKMVLEKDYNNPMLRINFKRNNNYMFRVRYYKNRIAIEYFHALTDGNYGMKFLKEIVYQYLEIAHEELMQKNNARGTLHFTTDHVAAYKDADAIFIGVGTPEMPDGSANLSYIATVSRQIAESVEKDCLVVVKSTVPVGTNDKVEQFIKDFLVHDVKVEVASNPEFLAQGTAVHDTLHAARIIIGTESKEAEELLKKIYEPFGLPIVSVKRRSAEMIKYACNDFLALKISYMNDIANLCELVGADITDVAKGMCYDERIGSRFLNAGIGFGGSCFPKDTKALKFLARAELPPTNTSAPLTRHTNPTARRPT